MADDLSRTQNHLGGTMALDIRRSVPLITEIRGSEGHALVLLTGELDVSTAGGLYQEFAQLNRDGVVHVALDLTGLEFIDSTGISAIIAEHKRTASAGGELIILTPHRNVRRVFEVAGLMDVLNVLPPDSSGDATG
ncbi:MAG TPA: STAS domain-containing protein [Acidimicrobiales bacterium]|jgi:anti-anti-sigma factor|nr:STAS domain-containing protein [Acidimicrobiales bacterium]